MKLNLSASRAGISLLLWTTLGVLLGSVTTAHATEMGNPEDFSDRQLTIADLMVGESFEVSANDGMAQVTSVSQLRDVQPTDWAFQALQSLVERYGCIAGYPDGTYRGNRAMTRYEFAAGLNACLDRVNELIAAGTGDLASQEDLVALSRLQEEFAAELATLRGRVDSLEARTAELEANQFSTTTKLFGQAIFGVQGRSNNRVQLFVDRFEDPDTKVNLINNVQLSLVTQFDPRSLLITGLQMGNGSTAVTRLTNDTRLGYEGNTNSNVILSDLNYRQLIGNNLGLIVGPAGVNMVSVFRGPNRIESAGQGSISAFGQRNPILNIGSGTGGLGFDWQITPRVSLQGVYSASNPAGTTGQAGLFDGRTTAGVQLTLAPTDTLDIGLNYVNSYSADGFLGTGIGDDQLTFGSPIKTNAIGATLAWRISPSLTLGTWGGYTSSTVPGSTGSVQTTNWMAFMNFPDLFGQGNLGGLFFGQPPKITSSDLATGNIPDFINRGGFGAPGGQPGTTLHLEAFYRMRVTDNISVTPGVIFIFNPRHNPTNDTITIGALRTTFTF